MAKFVHKLFSMDARLVNWLDENVSSRKQSVLISKLIKSHFNISFEGEDSQIMDKLFLKDKTKPVDLTMDESGLITPTKVSEIKNEEDVKEFESAIDDFK